MLENSAKRESKYGVTQVVISKPTKEAGCTMENHRILTFIMIFFSSFFMLLIIFTFNFVSLEMKQKVYCIKMPADKFWCQHLYRIYILRNFTIQALLHLFFLHGNVSYFTCLVIVFSRTFHPKIVDIFVGSGKVVKILLCLLKFLNGVSLTFLKWCKSYLSCQFVVGKKLLLY